MHELHMWSRTTAILKFIQNHQNAKKEEMYGFGCAYTNYSNYEYLDSLECFSEHDRLIENELSSLE